MMQTHASRSSSSAAGVLCAQDNPPADAGKKRPPRPPKPGVSTPGVKREMSAIQPLAVFPVEGTPDWLVITDDAVWVTNGPKGTVHRLDPKTNTVAAAITVGKRPCSGLAAGFGSIWVPNCGDKTLSRIDLKTNQVTATLPIPPSQSEGGNRRQPRGRSGWSPMPRESSRASIPRPTPSPRRSRSRRIPRVSSMAKARSGSPRRRRTCSLASIPKPTRSPTPSKSARNRDSSLLARAPYGPSIRAMALSRG